MTTITTAPNNELEQPDRHVHHSHRPLYLKIFAALMMLLVLTMVAAFIPLGNGAGNLFAALAIAMIKAVLILLFFMHFRDSDKLTWLIGAGTLVWFGILIALTMNDYWSRDWIQSIPGK